MKNGWGWVAGLSAAGLLVAGTPAYAGGDKAGSTAATDTKSDATLSGSGSTGSMGTSGSMGSQSGAEATQSGSAGTTDPAMGSSGSASATGSEHHASAMGSGLNQVTGKVDKFDQASNELTLSLKVSDSTQVKKDGQTASLNDIKEGDQVRASFSGSGDSLQVTEIEVMSPGSTGSSSDLGTGSSAGSSDKADTGLKSPSDAGSTGSSPSGTSGSSPSRGY